MQAGHRKPPPKKRHTKPCRFFQIAKCPLSTEECDFAHILSNEPQIPSPCKYFAVGRCSNGDRCRYRHDIEQSDATVERAAEAAIKDAASNPAMTTAYFDGRYPTSPGNTWDSRYLRSATSPIYSPGIPPPRLYYPRHFSSPATHSGESSGTISTSTSSSLSDDYSPAVMTEDPNYSEHYHQYQSRIHIAEEPPLVHVNPFAYGPSVSHASVPVLSLDTSFSSDHGMYGTYIFQQAVSPSSSVKSPRKSVSRSRSSRHKAINYKTKPCKFYKVAGACPNGSTCTFIHDDEPPASTPSTSKPKELPPSLPPKPLSIAEENRKKNYFPVSWRVIGGGVLMGEPKPSESTTPTWESETPGESERNNKDIQKNDLPSPKQVKRTRSSSNPPTLTTAHVKVDTLFSAESPGNL